jgi:hypothetical protein
MLSSVPVEVPYRASLAAEDADARESEAAERAEL